MMVGGCFDILHPGHIDFLEKAKKLCDKLVVLLEPDEKIREMKGKDRPKTNLESRILNLEKTGLVDKVITLPVLKNDEEYKKTIASLLHCFIAKNNPAAGGTSNGTMEQWNNEVIFGITKNDRNSIKNQKIRALGEKLEIEVIEVNELLPEWSTTKINQKLKIKM